MKRRHEERITVIDEGDLRKYRTELPNMIDDLNLSPFAYRLYGHYKRRAGANGGECTEGLRGLARSCRMSINSVRGARDELAALKLIKRRPAIDALGVRDYVSIVDIWAANFAKYAPRTVEGGVSDIAQGVSPADTGGVSRGDTEERTKRRKNQEEVKSVKNAREPRFAFPPETWAPDVALLAWARKQCPDILDLTVITHTWRLKRKKEATSKTFTLEQWTADWQGFVLKWDANERKGPKQFENEARRTARLLRERHGGRAA